MKRKKIKQIKVHDKENIQKIERGGKKDTNKEKYRMTANFLLGIKKAEVNEKTLLT